MYLLDCGLGNVDQHYAYLWRASRLSSASHKQAFGVILFNKRRPPAGQSTEPPPRPRFPDADWHNNSSQFLRFYAIVDGQRAGRRHSIANSKLARTNGQGILVEHAISNDA